MRIPLLDIAEAYEARQRQIAREAGARCRVARLQAQEPRQLQRRAHDSKQAPRSHLEQKKVAPVAAMLPGVAVSGWRAGTLGWATRFGNIIVPRIFSLGTFARRARQCLRHDGRFHAKSGKSGHRVKLACRRDAFK